METIVSINSSNNGSTGRIMRGISDVANAYGYITYNAYPKSRRTLPPLKNDIIISSVPVKFISTRLAYLTGLNGCFAWLSTLIFLIRLKKIKPTILHLHNLHDSYINLGMLFHYIKKERIKVIWTLHDCWSFTGHCAHFLFSGCEKWKSGCGHCSCLKTYPASIFDTTKLLWKKKKKWFSGVKDMTIVTPSKWLAELVKESFLGDYRIIVVNNGIDLNVFKPTESNVREDLLVSSK